ncbi:zinc ribbon domain-containing protein [Streptomyces sp. NPDC094438]|uniref:zinc ribbon domain-containing protein n=1 Tax=Streptomyces sp. NPDC094438 TaxID=3366061 RepID=UPI0038211085
MSVRGLHILAHAVSYPILCLRPSFRRTHRPYQLGGRMRCSICRRTMQGSFNNGHSNYRCRYTQEYARTAALDHLPTLYIREDAVVPSLDAWIAKIFEPGRLARTLHELQRSQERTLATAPELEVARITIADCDRRIAHHRAALDRATDPELVSGWINQTQAEKAAVERRLSETGQAQRTVLTDATTGYATTSGPSQRPPDAPNARSVSWAAAPR